MLRRIFFFTALLLSLFDASTQIDRNRHKNSFRRCRCVSTKDRCWPTAKLWNAFNSSVDGRLLLVRPVIAACEGNTTELDQCNLVLSQWTNASWRSDQPGAMQNVNWENNTCTEYTDGLRCTQGNIPRIGVNATSVQHVQTTVRFANLHNLRLVIKTTGHDYLGRSTAANSLLLWLHQMKNMTLIETFSSCKGEQITNALRVTAGVQWGDVYTWLAKYNLVAIGGAAPTVGAIGGYLQGGGHGPLTRWKGMAADQVLEFEVVTADGVLLTVNECQYPDLFWALRGGGGGTYGVVISAILRTYPSPSITSALLRITAENDQHYQRFLHDFVQMIPKLSDTNWSGYFYISDRILATALFVPNGNHTENIALYNQLFNNTTGLAVMRNEQFFTSFYDFFRNVMSEGNGVGGQVLLGSRLIPETTVRHRSDQLSEAFFQARGSSVNQSLLIGHLVAGKQVSNTSTNSSINPAWRTTLLHMVYSEGLPDESSNDDVKYAASQIRKHVNILQSAIGDSSASCYLNEADVYEPDWQEKFFGSRQLYNSLRAIKKKFDPNDLFICKNCVGSDDWNDDLNCRQRTNTNS